MKPLKVFVTEKLKLSDIDRSNLKKSPFWEMLVDIKTKYWNKNKKRSNPFAVALKKKAYTWDELCEFGDKFYDLAIEIDDNCEWIGHGWDDEAEYSTWGNVFLCNSEEDFKKIIMSGEYSNPPLYGNGELIAPPVKTGYDEEEFLEEA